MDITITKVIDGTDYTVTLDLDNSRVTISSDGRWAGTGRWTGQLIDCPAVLSNDLIWADAGRWCADQFVDSEALDAQLCAQLSAEEVYEALDEAIREALDARAKAVLRSRGFEVADDDDGDAFLADVGELLLAGDKEGLACRIIGGGTTGEAMDTADELLAAWNEED